MPDKKESIDSEKLSEIIVEGMKEKKARDIVVMDLRGVKNAIADFFILCTGTSDKQIDAIAESVEENVHKKAWQNVWHKEGMQNKEWILLDFVDVVANVFNNRTREFYSLEHLWGDAILKPVETTQQEL